jgi:hypothetical protein
MVAQEGIPTSPGGPALAFRLRLETHRALVRLSSSDRHGTSWTDLAAFKLKLDRASDKPRPVAELADRLAEAMVTRLVDVRLLTSQANGGRSYRIRIANDSPLILNTLVLTGPAGRIPGASATGLSSLGLGPRRAITLPATTMVVERLKLRGGIRILAANLGSL